MEKVGLRYKRVDDGRHSALAEVREDICCSSDWKSFNCYIFDCPNQRLGESLHDPFRPLAQSTTHIAQLPMRYYL